ncbi:MAG: hypothetical protein OXB95_00710 [Rhodobacteraceae bacterium]|nr:hypothetical protein [Paracoccaceae bacterium]
MLADVGSADSGSFGDIKSDGERMSARVSALASPPALSPSSPGPQSNGFFLTHRDGKVRQPQSPCRPALRRHAGNAVDPFEAYRGDGSL